MYHVSPLLLSSIAYFLLIVGLIFQKQAVAFLVAFTNQQYTAWSSSNISPYCGPIRSCHFNFHRRQRLGHRGFCSQRRFRSRTTTTSLREDDSADCDTFESLSEVLSGLLSANEADSHPTTESDHSQDRQLQRQRQQQQQLLITRLSNIDSFGVDSKHIHINRTYVEKSTIADAGLGLFVREDYPEGTLLTCYPGDALVDLASDSDDVLDIDADIGQGRVTWGSHAKKATTTTTTGGGGGDGGGDGNTNSMDGSKFNLRQEYMLRAVCDRWGIVAVPELFGDADPSYLGHFANDGATHSPRCESELAAYVIESTDKANAMHQPCEDCHMITVATRDLKAGEEIFVTYGPDYWRGQASFVPSSSSSQDDIDEDHYDDSFDDEDLDDYDYGYDDYDNEVEAIVTESISLPEESSESSESSSRGKGFG